MKVYLRGSGKTAKGAPVPVTGPAALDERPRRRRAALLAAPWVLALGLGVVAVATGPGASTPPDVPASEAASPTPTARPGPARSGPAQPARTPPVATDGLPAATHLQVLAQARAALGTAGLAAQDGGRSDRWPVEVRLADVVQVTDTLAIATVHALVIELAESAWTGPVAHAVAVPLTTSPDARVAGPAWPIAAPPLTVVAPDGQAVADPDPVVLTPLEEHGWAVDELTSVELVGGAVLRVRLVGVPPGGHTEPGHHVVWLLDAPGGPRLLPLETTHTTQEST